MFVHSSHISLSSKTSCRKFSIVLFSAGTLKPEPLCSNVPLRWRQSPLQMLCTLPECTSRCGSATLQRLSAESGLSAHFVAWLCEFDSKILTIVLTRFVSFLHTGCLGVDETWTMNWTREWISFWHHSGIISTTSGIVSPTESTSFNFFPRTRHMIPAFTFFLRHDTRTCTVWPETFTLWGLCEPPISKLSEMKIPMQFQVSQSNFGWKFQRLSHHGCVSATTWVSDPPLQAERWTSTLDAPVELAQTSSSPHNGELPNKFTHRCRQLNYPRHEAVIQHRDKPGSLLEFAWFNPRCSSPWRGFETLLPIITFYRYISHSITITGAENPQQHWILSISP